MSDRVRFLGFVPEPDNFYPTVDIFLNTSSYEGLPYSVLDAMAWGLPVVGFDVVGVNDLVLPKETGLLAEPFRIDEMAELVVELASDPVRSRALGQAGHDRARTHFRLDKQIDGLMEVYRSLVAGDSH